MNNHMIDSKQLFCMMVLFELGSALLFGLGADAKQDAWLAVLLGMIAGILLFLVYSSLYHFSDRKSLIYLLKAVFGRHMGWILGWIYVVYFIYFSSRVLRDFVDLLRLAAYDKTTFLTLAIGMVLCVMYASYKGIEVFARFSLITFFLVMVSLAGIIILQFLSGNVQLQNLQPVLEDGIMPVLKASFPTLAAIPYGELIVFLMLFPSVQQSSKIRKTGIKSIYIGGGTLVLFSIINLSILGADVYSRSSFPLLTSVGLINIADFVQRIESILIFLMVLLGFVKVFLLAYGAILGTSELFQIRKIALIYPITFLILISSVIISNNSSEHIKEGFTLAPIYFHLPMTVFIPSILLLAAWIKKKKTPALFK
ncbi:Nutrient germinant receptor inner membrane subunit B (GerKB/GerAB/GerBB) [Bacillus sp. ZZV12-4809]|nr:Nutrient germinant receptor inner membrane subunit B (GerKB/GerAB/GerBB) [Bacillus sp. ZZV12-4809]